MSRPAVRRPRGHVRWRPVISLVSVFDLAVDWEGQDGPPVMPFVAQSPVTISVPGETMTAAVWIAPAFGVRLLASIDETPHGRLLHISVSQAAVLPPWPIMIAIKRHFFPADVAAAMLMPEEDVYVNVQTRTLHIWQLPEKWRIS